MARRNRRTRARRLFMTCIASRPDTTNDNMGNGGCTAHALFNLGVFATVAQAKVALNAAGEQILAKRREEERGDYERERVYKPDDYWLHEVIKAAVVKARPSGQRQLHQAAFPPPIARCCASEHKSKTNERTLAARLQPKRKRPIRPVGTATRVSLASAQSNLQSMSMSG